jgi:hypothetical protein
LWNEGTIAWWRTFQMAGLVGMRPLPMMGSRISTSIPLQYFLGLVSHRTWRTMTGLETTRNDSGPKERLKTGLQT